MNSGNEMFEQKFKRLKKFDFDKATISFWIVNRHLYNREAAYSILNVNIDEKLPLKLGRIVRNKVENSNEYTEYDFLTVDNDQQLLTLSAGETDFIQIFDQIQKGTDNDKVKSNEDLATAWGYVIKIKDQKSEILAFKKLPEKWDLKKRNPIINTIFRDQKFIDLEEDEIFKIQQDIDFVCFDDVLFILNKKQFELGLNFREGMKKNRDIILDELVKLNIVSDIAPIKDRVGDNLRHLRQISTIHKNGYFKHPDFMEKLRKINKQEGWGLTFEKGVIKVDDSNIGLVLTVLNKDRLKDLIEGETFDVAVKKPVTQNGAK